METLFKKIIVLLFWANNCVFAQNLVPNPSFEEYTDCPYAPAQLEFAKHWINPTQGSPEYFNANYCGQQNTCSVPDNGIGYQNAKTGVAYSGLYAYSYNEPNLREYIQIKLIQKLKKRNKYQVGFYCNLRDNYCNLAANSLGAFFSLDAISRNDMLLFDTIPQLVNSTNNLLISKTEWMLVSDTIEAIGEEEYITIGNFFQDSLTDTVSVYDSFGGNYWGYKKPYYLIDDVFVIPLDSLTGINQAQKLEGKVYYANGYINITLRGISYKPLEVTLSTATGQQVWQSNTFYTQNEQHVPLPPLPQGIYFVEVKCGNGIKREKLNIQQE